MPNSSNKYAYRMGCKNTPSLHRRGIALVSGCFNQFSFSLSWNWPSRLFLVGFLFTAIALFSQNYSLSKYPKKFSPITREEGPKPGSAAPEDARSASYQRRVIYPAALRVLFRSDCEKPIQEKKLIERAKKLPKNAAPQMLDFGTLGKGKVGYYAVLETRIYEMELPMSVKDGKYKPAGKVREVDSATWKVERITLGSNGEGCFDPKSIKEKDLRIGLENILVAVTLEGFRAK